MNALRAGDMAGILHAVSDASVPGYPEVGDGRSGGPWGKRAVGFTREGFYMQGLAYAVELYEHDDGLYVYLAAGAVLQVYCREGEAAPVLVAEIEFRDRVKDMIIKENTLFVTAGGDGLHAIALDDPSNPKRAGCLHGTFDTPRFSGIDAVFLGVDAFFAEERYFVAVTRDRFRNKAYGGADAVVFEYDPETDEFSSLRAFGTEIRADRGSGDPIRTPFPVKWSSDGSALWIGYVFDGEVSYIPLNYENPEEVLHFLKKGSIWDLEVVEEWVFVAAQHSGSRNMLIRLRVEGGEIVNEPLMKSQNGLGVALDSDGDLLCFATCVLERFFYNDAMFHKRWEHAERGGYNLWLFKDLMEPVPTLLDTACTMDWVFDIACRNPETGSDRIYVADEWGGLQLWEYDGHDFTLKRDPETGIPATDVRIPTGAALTGKMWSDGSRVFALKAGAGVWYLDDADPAVENVAVEWIYESDPGCQRCPDCCPPGEMKLPYPAAVFGSGGCSSLGRIALLVHDRNSGVAWAENGYFMIFEDDAQLDRYECMYSEPVRIASGGVVADHDSLIYVTAEERGSTVESNELRVYRHDPSASIENQAVLLGSIFTPVSTETSGGDITAVAVYGEYLFVAEMIPFWPWGRVYVYLIDGLPDELPEEPLGYFCGDMLPATILVDETGNQLLVGCTTGGRIGGLLLYDLSKFDPAHPEQFDLHRVNITADVKNPSISCLFIDDDDLYMTDTMNGLFLYSLKHGIYKGYYPGYYINGSTAIEWPVLDFPEGVVPLYDPVAVTITPSGRILVHEHLTGRIPELKYRVNRKSLYRER
jgi:hypothetical protein